MALCFSGLKSIENQNIFFFGLPYKNFLSNESSNVSQKQINTAKCQLQETLYCLHESNEKSEYAMHSTFLLLSKKIWFPANLYAKIVLISYFFCKQAKVSAAFQLLFLQLKAQISSRYCLPVNHFSF